MTPEHIRVAAAEAGGLRPLARQLGIPYATLWAQSKGYSAAGRARKPEAGIKPKEETRQKLAKAIHERTARVQPPRRKIPQPGRPYMLTYRVPQSKRYKDGYANTPWQDQDRDVADVLDELGIDPEDVDTVSIEW